MNPLRDWWDVVWPSVLAAALVMICMALLLGGCVSARKYNKLESDWEKTARWGHEQQQEADSARARAVDLETDLAAQMTHTDAMAIEKHAEQNAESGQFETRDGWVWKRWRKAIEPW